MTSSLIQSGRPPARASRAVRTASSAVSHPDVFGSSNTSAGRYDVMSSPGSPNSMRRTATVTIAAPEARTASRIVSKLSYFPVPRMRREPKLRPAIVTLSSMLVPSASMTQIRFSGRGLVTASQRPCQALPLVLSGYQRGCAPCLELGTKVVDHRVDFERPQGRWRAPGDVLGHSVCVADAEELTQSANARS